MLMASSVHIYMKSVRWILLLFPQFQLVAATLFLSSFLYLYMAWVKVNMPLHFDLEERSKHDV